VPRPELTWLVHGDQGWAWEKVRFGRLEPVEFWYVVGAALLITIYIMRRLELGRTGRAWVAIREDELAAQAAGINVTWYKTKAFAISAAVAGFGGGLYAAVSGNLSFYDFNFFISVYLVLYVVFGGMGSIVGTMLGTVVLYYLLELLRDLIAQWNNDHPDGQIDANLRYIFYAVVLILIMRYRPTGLLPPKARLRERLPSQLESDPRLCHLCAPESNA
jgi:branched-chain amino acid transport system permease protein